MPPSITSQNKPGSTSLMTLNAIGTMQKCQQRGPYTGQCSSHPEFILRTRLEVHGFKTNEAWQITTLLPHKQI